MHVNHPGVARRQGEQVLHNRHEPILRSQVQRDTAGVVNGVHVRARLDDHAQALWVR
jgi:hypothetical protein